MTPDEPRRSTLSAMGRALRHRNYRLFFFGQGTSLVGTWLTRVAMSWLVYRLTSSALLLGIVGFAGQIPTFLFAPVAGVMVDRWNRHRVLVVTQVLAMIQSALLAFVAFRGTTIWQVTALAVFQGVINAFDTPARQAFVVEMVDKREDLANAIALNSSMVTAARLIGPSVAGILIAAVGEGYCFAIDAASYLAVIVSLLLMRIPPRAIAKSSGNIISDFSEGFRYVAGSVPIRSILLLLALVSLTGIPYTVLMPVFADKIMHGGAGTFGILMTAAGAGAVAGTLWLASRPSVLGLGRALSVAGIAFGAGLVAFSFSRAIWLSVPVLIITGGGMMVQMAASNTLLQTIVDEDKRGRVMSFYTMAFFGMVPFGSLLAGWAGGLIGAPATVFWGGVATLVAVGLFVRKLPDLRRAVRPIYIRLGIINEVAPPSEH